MDNTRKNGKASDQQPKELTEAEKIQAMMKQDNPEYDPTNLPPIPKKWTSRPRTVYKRVHYPNRTWRKAEATPSTSECPQVKPKELLCNLAKKLVDNDSPADMTEISPACLPTSHQQMAQISTKLHRPERPVESLSPRVEGLPQREVGSERPPSSGPNGSPKNAENFGCGNIQRDGGPWPPQQQQHWGQQPHMWTPPNVSPPFCATQLTVGPPLGYDDPFHGVPLPEYMPPYQSSYSWQPQPEMSDHHPYPGYYFEGQPYTMHYVHGGRESAREMYAHNSPPYRMDGRLVERENKFARSEIKDPVQEFERFLAEKDSRKLAMQTFTTVRKRPRSRSISPMSRRTSRNSSERSQSRRRRSFSRSPSPKRRRSYSKRRDGKSRTPSRNTTSNRKEKRIFGEHVENETQKEKRPRKDRKEKRKDESCRSRSKRCY